MDAARPVRVSPAARPERGSVSRAPAFPFILLAALFLAEFFLFDVQTSRHFAWIYPRWNDQVQYLTECYTGFEFRQARGFWPGIWQTLVNPSAQGTLHDFWGVLVFSLVGPSRSAALSLNVLATIAWQAALFVGVSRSLGSRGLAWAAVMLPLALRWPWSVSPGSAIDFRLDHFAMCALGVTSSLALLTNGFRSRIWSIVFGLAVGGTLLTRFITGPYFVLIFAGLMIWALCSVHRKIRSFNLLLAMLAATVLAGPILWLNRQWVWNYYWIGHFTGPESALRNPHMGIGRSLRFVTETLAKDQVGIFFWLLVLAGTALLVSAVLLERSPERKSNDASNPAWIIGAIFLLAPFTILTLHQLKSPVVIGSLAPGLILLVAAGWAKLQQRLLAGWPTAALAFGTVAAASGYFAAKEVAPDYDAAFASDARQVLQLADYIFSHARAAGLTSPRVAVDQVTDSLDAQILRVIAYERHRVWVPFVMTLPTGIAEEKESLLLDRLANSDFVFLTEGGAEGGWPYDRQMRALLPRTHAWCEANLQFVKRFTLFGRRMVLYQRREIP
jgi:hypothetical protein